MIKKEGKGDLQNVFLNLVKCIQNKKSLYFADWLYSSMKGKWTHDTVLIRTTVSCSEGRGHIEN